jgi:PAS domain-containing protein
MLPATLGDMLALHAWSYTEINSDSLFAASDQAILIVDADTGIILRANPAASLLLNLPSAALVDAALVSIFDDAGALELRRNFSVAKTSGSATASMLSERRAGRCLSVQLSLVLSVPKSYVLARLESSRSAARGAPQLNPESAVLAAIDAAPIGFLIAAGDFHVDYANPAFVRMVKARSQAAVRGSSLLRWLRFNAADLSRLRARLSQRHAADILTTVLHPNLGLPQHVEVCAVPVPDAFDSQWAFTVRELPLLN